MTGRLLTSDGRSATGRPICDAALRLDFYLPPPDHRAFRRNKIQRLRDQITAWRRSPLRGGGQRAAEGPTWGSAAAAAPPPRALLRSGRMFHGTFSTLPADTWRSLDKASRTQRSALRTTPFFSDTKSSGIATGKSVVTSGRVSDTPYFHDYAFFCLPSTGGASAAGANVAKAQRSHCSAISCGAAKDIGERGVDICCGVTANKEEMAQHAGRLNISARLLRSGKSDAPEKAGGDQKDMDAKGTDTETLSLLLSTTPGEMRTGTGDAAPRGNKLESLFLARTEGVELAATIHAECTRRQLLVDQRRKSVERQRTFNRTMEVPIDWGEFERLPSRNATSLLSTSLRGRTSSFAGMESTFASKPPGAVHVHGHKGPMRLYTIRMEDSGMGLGSERKAKAVSRHGKHVILPELWLE